MEGIDGLSKTAALLALSAVCFFKYHALSSTLHFPAVTVCCSNCPKIPGPKFAKGTFAWSKHNEARRILGSIPVKTETLGRHCSAQLGRRCFSNQDAFPLVQWSLTTGMDSWLRIMFESCCARANLEEWCTASLRMVLSLGSSQGTRGPKAAHRSESPGGDSHGPSLAFRPAELEIAPLLAKFKLLPNSRRATIPLTVSGVYKTLL